MAIAGTILGVFLLLTVLTVPVTTAIAGAAVVGVIAAGFSDAFYIVPQQTLEGINSSALLAVPFFILAGGLLNKLGMTDRIFNFAEALVGHFRAGLAQVNVLASLIFAGISGAAVADCAGLGMVEVKAMRERGYSPDFAAAVTMASSIVGPIFPPSIPLVIYAFVSSTSVGRLFLAGILPAIVIVIGLMSFIWVLSIRQKFPTQPRASLGRILRTGVDGVIALVAPTIIIAAMVTGFTTASEAGVIACVYTLIAGLFYRTLSWRKLWEALTETTLLTSMILLMLGFSTVMGWVMAIEQVPQVLAEAVLTTIDSVWVFLLAYILFFLVIGCVFDTLAAMIILMPILLPLIDQFSIDRVHFGIVTVFALMIGILTPPLGIALYIMMDVSKLSFERLSRAAIPFLIPLVIVLIIIAYVPEISLWLPDMIMGPD
jgi:tripartite ATP-independent transporter DctM subunit